MIRNFYNKLWYYYALLITLADEAPPKDYFPLYDRKTMGKILFWHIGTLGFCIILIIFTIVLFGMSLIMHFTYPKPKIKSFI